MESIFYKILKAWLGISAILISIIGVIIYWAIKTKQFSNNDHAKILPLISGIPDDEEDVEVKKT